MPTSHTSDHFAAELLSHVRVLAEQIGERHTGSPANRAAATYIADHFRRAGWSVEELPFECPGWSCTATTLHLGDEPLHAAANAITPACELTLPTVAVETVAALEAAELTGKVAVLYGDLTREPLIPLNCPVYNTDRDQHINRTLIAKQPAAILTVNPHLSNVERRIEDPDLPIPSATVPAEVGARLLHAVGAPVHLRIDSTRTIAQAAHILAHKPGPRPERITLMAHFDSKPGTPGAWDNASGSAALLGLATALADRALGCGLELIAFADEDTFGYDDPVYMGARRDQLDTILAAINLDGIGHILGHNTIMIESHSEDLRLAAEQVTAHYPRVQWVDPWPQSDHSSFSWRGVPAFALSSSVAWEYAHQPTDTPLWIDPAGLAEAVALVTDLVAAIHDQPLTWARPAPQASA